MHLQDTFYHIFSNEMITYSDVLYHSCIDFCDIPIIKSSNLMSLSSLIIVLLKISPRIFVDVFMRIWLNNANTST